MFIKVGTNGHLVLLHSLNSPTLPFLDLQASSYIIAAFWDDIDIGNGGSIKYEIFESGYLLDEVNEYLQRIRPTSFEGTWMLLASYDKVGAYSGSGEVGTILTIMELCKPTV